MAEEMSPTRDSSAWLAVLDRLIGEMGRALEQLPVTPAPSPANAADYPPLQALDRRLAQMQGGLQRAEVDVTRAELELAAVIDPLQQWLTQLRASRDKLSEAARE